MQALGLIETKGLVPAIESADAMLKAADVSLLEKTYVGGGLVSILVTGDVAAVKAAVEAGSAAVKILNSTLLISQHVIPRPHEELDNLIVPAIPLKDRDMSTAVAEETSEITVKVEETEQTVTVVEETVSEDLVLEDSEGKEVQTEKEAVSLKMDLNEINKEAVDKMILEHGLEETIKVLSNFKVVKLRKLARQYKNFGIAGRAVSKAGKKLLITKFKEYYGNN